MRRALLLIVLLIGLPILAGGPAAAEMSAKRPAVIDAATLAFPGQPIRLHGLQALHPGQHCRLGTGSWPCGAEARSAVIFRININWVVCLEQSVDSQGVLTAICYLGGVGGPELNAWVAERGWALAKPEESDRYVAAVQRARRLQKGIWRGVAP